MNDEKRAALVEELAGILQGCVIIANMDEDAPPTEVSAGTINNIAYSILPIIERMAANRAVAGFDLDEETAVVRDLGSVLRLEYARGYGDAKREQQFNVVSSTTYLPIAAMPSCADADDEPYLGPPDKGVTVKATVVEADDVPMFPDLGTDADNWLDAALDAAGVVGATVERLTKRGGPTTRWGATIYTDEFEYQSGPQPTPSAAIDAALAQKEREG